MMRLFAAVHESGTWPITSPSIRRRSGERPLGNDTKCWGSGANLLGRLLQQSPKDQSPEERADNVDSAAAPKEQ